MAATYGSAGSAGYASVKYAGQSGCKPDGTTDNTAAVQAVLDSHGSAGTPLEFVFDQAGTYLISGSLQLWSNQTLRGLGYPTLKKAGHATSDSKPIVTNKHWVAYGGGSQVDQFIRIEGLRLDGNQRGGAYGASTSATPWQTAAGYQVVVIGLYGVNEFTVSDVHIYDACAYSVHMAYSTNGLVTHVSKELAGGNVSPGSDVLHFNGGCSAIQAIGCWGATNDDPVSICSNDGNDATPPLSGDFWAGSVHQGPISNLRFFGCTFSGNQLGDNHFARLLSSNPACPITDILFQGCTAPSQYPFINIENFGLPLGNGWYDNITISDCTAPPTDSSSSAAGLLRADTANIGRIVIRNASVITSGALTDQPAALIILTSNSNLYSLEVDGLYVSDPNGRLTCPIASLGGTMTRFLARNWILNRGTQATLSQSVIASSGSNYLVQVEGGSFDRIANLLKVTAGSVTVAMTGGASHTNAGGGASFAQTGGTFGTLYGGSTNSVTLNSGTIGTVITAGGGAAPSGPFVDSFSGTAALAVTSHTSDSGATWPNDASHLAGANGIQLDGQPVPGLFLATSDSANIPSAAMPTGNFLVEFGILRYTALAAGESADVTFFVSAPYGTFASRYAIEFQEPGGNNTGIFFYKDNNGAGRLGSTVALPTVGVVTYYRCRILTVTGTTTFQCSYSTDRINWTDLGVTGTSSGITDPVAIGAYMSGAGWTATTGPHLVGPLTYRSID
jgi:hypothetical protein